MLKPAFLSPSRRAVMLSLAGSAVAAGLLSVSDVRNTRRNGTARPRIFGKKATMAEADFEQWNAAVGSSFFAITEAGAIALKLVSVTALPIVGSRPASLRRQPFEAEFSPEGDAKLPVGDRLYLMRQPGNGTFHLYFSPAHKALKAMFN